AQPCNVPMSASGAANDARRRLEDSVGPRPFLLNFGNFPVETLIESPLHVPQGFKQVHVNLEN
ncbi:hypothetical protein PO883_12465, partial [Massilia sp. DJPM01]|uniref:hypothetical protein n=1 Tax=Massilia sp. DJPM01 TaxID=3024404 RepID=UPI00259E22F0